MIRPDGGREQTIYIALHPLLIPGIPLRSILHRRSIKLSTNCWRTPCSLLTSRISKEKILFALSRVVEVQSQNTCRSIYSPLKHAHPLDLYTLSSSMASYRICHGTSIFLLYNIVVLIVIFLKANRQKIS